MNTTFGSSKSRFPTVWALFGSYIGQIQANQG